MLREHAAKADSDRRLSDEVDEALVNSGLFALLTPERFGGYEAGARTLLEVTEALGQGDPSAAWLVAVGTTGSWTVGQFSERARQEVFGTTAAPRIAGASEDLMARQVDGGLVLNGRWSFASGSDRAQWAALGCGIANDAGQPVGAALSLVAADQLVLQKTWQTVGMRATASDTWIAEDVFVPDYRYLPLHELLAGRRPFPVEEPMYRLSVAAFLNVGLLGPIIGAGLAALSLVVDKAPAKAIQRTVFAQQSLSVGVQIQIGQAAMRLKSARLQAYDIVDELDSAAARGEELPRARRAEMRAQVGYVAQEVLAAINILVNVHGAGTFAEANRLQQLWRDANTGARHTLLNSVVGYEVLGKDLLSIDTPVVPMV